MEKSLTNMTYLHTVLCLPKILNGLKSLIRNQGKLVQNVHGLRLADSLITAKRKYQARLVLSEAEVKDSQNLRNVDNQLNIGSRSQCCAEYLGYRFENTVGHTEISTSVESSTSAK